MGSYPPHPDEPPLPGAVGLSVCPALLTPLTMLADLCGPLPAVAKLNQRSADCKQLQSKCSGTHRKEYLNMLEGIKSFMPFGVSCLLEFQAKRNLVGFSHLPLI